jgi:hypothetical protein
VPACGSTIGAEPVTTTMGDLMGALEDIEEIKHVRATYGRAADTRDYELLRTTITDDYTCDTGGGPTVGAEAFMERVKTNPADMQTAHHALMPEIALTSPTTATGIWAVHIMARFDDGRAVDSFGHYHDTYAKVDGTWLLESLKLEWIKGKGREL